MDAPLPEDSADAAQTDASVPTPIPLGAWACFLAGIALMGAVSFFSYRSGYRSGLLHPVCAPGLGGLIALFLCGVEFVVLIRLCSKWASPPSDATALRALLFFFLLAPLGWMWRSAGEVNGGSLAFHREAHDLELLKTMGVALDAYHAENGAYPATLKDLLASPSYIRLRNKDQAGHLENSLPTPVAPVPCSAFDPNPPMRYALSETDAASPGGIWFLWFAGPDGAYDIQDGPALKAELRSLAINPAEFSPWFAARDVQYQRCANKAGGDYVLWKGMGLRDFPHYLTLIREAREREAEHQSETAVSEASR